jgi:hypothetical protein
MESGTMAAPFRLLVGLLVALGLSAAQPTDAAGTQVADCSFATLQTDLEAGGDWYYTPGQCTSPIVFTGTITISANASLTAQGHDITLDGGRTLTVDGGGLFSVNAGTNFGLAGLTVSHGGGDFGGAFHNEGTVTITSATFSHNSSQSGGAIDNQGGTLTISESTLSRNSADDGGAIDTVSETAQPPDGMVTITDSTLSDNSARFEEGGAINSQGGATLTITSSTLSGNSSAGHAGAIYDLSGPLTITNSTLSGNSASSDGGAIETSHGTVTITSSTFSGNSSPAGGTIYNSDSSTVNIGGSIVAGSTGGNCDNVSDGTITDKGYNLEWSGAGHTDTCGFGASGKHDIRGVDPQLSPLANNGGPTQTMALASTSPAIDQIPTTSGLCPATDQRGIARPDNGGASCDIGAYEFGGTLVTTTAAPTSTKTATASPAPATTATAAPTPTPVRSSRVLLNIRSTGSRARYESPTFSVAGAWQMHAVFDCRSVKIPDFHITVHKAGGSHATVHDVHVRT